MRLFAESARPCCALLLAAAVTAGTATVAIATSSSAPKADEPRAHVHKMRGCGTKGRAAEAARPPVQAEDPYVATLRSARPAFEACLDGFPGVQIRLALDLTPAGKVENVEVRTMADDVSKIDMRIVKCVQTAVSGLTFPASDAPKRISTFLRP
jgi:hypothetical protein